jgi:hypothetical protein
MTVTTDKANGLIVTSAAVSGVLMLVKDATTGHGEPVRGLLGLTFASLGLAVLAESAPNLAFATAGLVLIASVFTYGAPAWNAITGATSAPAHDSMHPISHDSMHPSQRNPA